MMSALVSSIAVPPLVGDPRFYACAGPFSLGAVAAAAGATVDAAMAERAMLGIAPLQTATPDQVSFLDNRRYLAELAATRAGAVLVQPELVNRVPTTTIPVLINDPYGGWARVAALFHPEPAASPGIDPTALVDEGADLGASVEVGPYAVIGAGARIGVGTRISAHAVIGPGVVVGADCRIGAHVTISHALLGDRVRLYPGVRVGQDGFGFATTPQGFLSVPQLGRVVLEDDVEVGANTTIDRGSVQDTVIGAGSRLDNLVQIGHNVRIGRCCVIVAQVGISGSTVLEDFVVVGGQAGFVGHLRIGARAKIGAQTGVMADVEAGSEVVGSPAEPARDFFRMVAWLRRASRKANGAGDNSAG
jgi:UDP-3-O-[3-hydroxymyristoyl] glucosamine N-acyltransferase